MLAIYCLMMIHSMIPHGHYTDESNPVSPETTFSVRILTDEFHFPNNSIHKKISFFRHALHSDYLFEANKFRLKQYVDSTNLFAVIPTHDTTLETKETEKESVCFISFEIPSHFAPSLLLRAPPVV